VIPLVWVLNTALLTVPAALLWGLLRSRLPRGGLADLYRELGTRRGVQLEAGLAKALGDPRLVLAYRVPGGLGYIDGGGQPVAPPAPGGDRTAAPIERDGRELGMLVYDASLDDDPELVEAVAATAAIALQSRIRTDPALAEQLVSSASDELSQSLEELRELARGIHPAVLNHGLQAALKSLASRASVPTSVSLESAERLPEPVELAAYFVACEALANIAKYAQATQTTIRVSRRDGLVVVEIADDGVGGADESAGTGLQGLADRVAALDGTLRILSPPGGGTVVTAELPCES
jgi:signal transduction histidine kinase